MPAGISPAASLRTLSRVQVGLESSAPGTEAAATRLLLLDNPTFTWEQALHTFEGQPSGYLTRSVRPPTVTRNGGMLECEVGLDPEQILLPLLSGMDGGVTPTTPDAINDPNARLWTFASDPTAPDVDTYTIECTIDDGTDQDEFTATYGHTTELEISATYEGVPTMRWTMRTRSPVEKASATGLTVPTLQSIPNLDWQMYVDGTWANLGTTAITDQVLGFTWRFTGGTFPRYTLDGRTALDFSRVGFGFRAVDLTVDILHSAASADLVIAERANKAAGTRRAVRLILDDGVVITGGTALTTQVILDGYFEHAEDSLANLMGTDDQGEVTTQLHFLLNLESTAVQDVQVQVQNAVTSFP